MAAAVRPLRARVASRLACACVVFSAFAARIATPLCWDTTKYIPVLSPVYRQQEHWIRSKHGGMAVAVHVSCGIVMLLAIVFQLDGAMRKARPRLHRLGLRVIALRALKMGQ